MSRDKQTEINELAKSIFMNCHCGLFEDEAEMIAKWCYQEIERKIADVARAIFEEVGKVIHKWGALAEQDNSDYAELTELILSDIATSIAELKKKYESEKDNG